MQASTAVGAHGLTGERHVGQGVQCSMRAITEEHPVRNVNPRCVTVRESWSERGTFMQSSRMSSDLTKGDKHDREGEWHMEKIGSMWTQK